MIFDTGAMSTPRTRKTPRARKTRTRTKDPVQKVLPGGALELRFAVTGMSAFLLTVVCSNHYYRTWIVDDVAPRPPRRNRQVSVVKVVDPEAPKATPKPHRVATDTGATIHRRGHQEQPSADVADVSPPPLRVPPPVIAAPSVPALPASTAVSPGLTPAPSTPIHDHDSNPFIGPSHTPHNNGAHPVTPTTEQRFWAYSSSSSARLRGTPRAGPHSPTRRSPRCSPRPSKASKKADDVKTFFEDSDETRSCLFCKYVYLFV